jgi:hypothetical protein
VKERNCKTSKNQGERSQPRLTKSQRKHWKETSFMFHRVADNNTYLILLSFFTYTHVYAPAHAYLRARVRQGGKEEKTSSGDFGVRPPDRHRCPNGTLCVANSSLTRTSSYNATVGQPWPLNANCQTGRFNRYFRQKPLSRGAWEGSAT